MIRGLAAVILFLFALPAHATTCGNVPYTFTNGTIADASQVNSNFSTIYNCGNNNLAPNSVTATGATTAATNPNRFGHILNVVDDFGADASGVADSTTSVQAAVTAACAAGGGQIKFPAGTFSFNTVTVPCAFITVLGDGQATRINKRGTTGNLFTVTGAFFEASNLYIDGNSSSSSGIIFSMDSGSENYRLRDITIVNAYDAITFGGGQVFLTNLLIDGTKNNGVVGASNFLGFLIIDNMFMANTGDNNTGTGILLQAGDTLKLSNISIQAFKHNIQLIPAAAKTLANVLATNVLADGVTRVTGIFPGWELDGSAAGATLARVKLVNSWAGTNIGDGLSAKSVDALELDGFISINNGLNGVSLVSSVTNTLINGGIFTGNSVSSSGTYSGIHVANNISKFTINNTIAQQVGAGIANTQKYGIEIIGATNNYYSIVGNQLTTNLTGGLLDSGTGANRTVGDNVGVNDVIAALTAATTITPGDGSVVTITGTTPVVTINNGWEGRVLVFAPLDNTPFHTGGNIVAAVTAVAPSPIVAVYAGGVWWLGHP